ncbi:MAG: glucoamylase family protein [Desulfamplus sp.]
MKIHLAAPKISKVTTTLAIFFNLRGYLQKDTPEQELAGNEMTLRSELFSSSQMEEHGRTLAGLHFLDEKKRTERLLTRLADNEKVLIDARLLLIEAVNANRRIAPAGEWLLDNFYLIEEQIRTAKRLLPKGYSRELPRLKKGPSRGLPRVYDIALETIYHGDGRVDPERLTSFVSAYQTITVLQMGELWAIPIMLRLALIENLRQVAVRIAIDRNNRNLADYWADKISDIAENDKKSIILTIADMARSNPPMVSSFIAELTRRLQGQGSALVLSNTWIEQQISDSYLTIAQLVQAENQQQAADQLSISNSIGSLRFLRAMDWCKFVDTMSMVEKTLRDDPAGIYHKMDFATRDQYRHVVEDVAKKSRLSENDVAREAINLAKESKTVGLDIQNTVENSTSKKESLKKNGLLRTTHVGFYLVDNGLCQLEKRAKVRSSVVDMVQKIGRGFPLFLYLGTTLIFTLLFSAALIAESRSDPLLKGSLLLFVGILSLISVSQLSIAVVNLIAIRFTTPRPLPRMDFSKAIPPQYSTLVVVPTMLASADNVANLIDAMEVRFIANRDENLRFGLLTDFCDASEEKTDKDEPLLTAAQQNIEVLNRKYSDKEDIFFLFHRPRQWNQQEKVWMGYERKRGKLAELNQLILGGSGSGFSLIVGNREFLSKVKYVITLDTDTELPRDSARQLVGAMAHPLNLPHYDADRGRIVSGYGILQPRVSVSLPGTNRSRYAGMWGSDAGIDPYTRVVSDLYQDIFGQGSFVGKGIYDVDAFEQVLRERFPENQILSHDLIEGCYARSGFISDIELYEEYPSRYSADVSRRRRWIRGDWQLLRWLFPCVPGINTSCQKNPISILSRWKIFDNLRRSLVPSALCILLLLGWTLLSSPLLFTSAIIGIVVIPSLISSLMAAAKKQDDTLVSQHLTEAVHSTGRGILHSVFAILCLPYEAYYSTTAILRTLWLMLVSGRGLLEWNPPEKVCKTGRTDIVESLLRMWIAPAIAISAGGYLFYLRPEVLPVALPILTLWFISPVAAWWLSLPLSSKERELDKNQTIFLRKLSRKSWAFFETFVGPDDHWLPPDNYQEEPLEVVAHRTSPTNMGFSLLSNLSACDFGYISVGRLIDRTSNSLNTMGQLKQYRGHFYNWYDTKSLEPLLPMYVSSVDSGNLAASLLTLQAGLLELIDEKLIAKRLFDGISDTAMVLVDIAEERKIAKERDVPERRDIVKKQGFAKKWGVTEDRIAVTLAQFTAELKSISESSSDKTLFTVRNRLERLVKSANDIDSSFKITLESKDNAEWWARTLLEQCESAVDELNLLAPWTQSSFSKQTLNELPSLSNITTLRQLADIDISSIDTEIDNFRINNFKTPDNLRKAEVPDKLRKIEQPDNLREIIIQSSIRAKERIAFLEELALHAGELAGKMEYPFLYDYTRHQLVIGYNVSDNRRDESYYDLLASEARLANFVAIAQGQLPQESWFALGRLLTNAGGESALLSWSGSMFEYLMPLLVMPTYKHSLLDQTCKAAVARQIEYGKERGVPWGISESSYNMTDSHLNYQYKAFGVPGLGLKRGLAGDLVIAPYASALALMVAPDEACRNLEIMSSQGFEGKYGFYEAVDYTPTHLPQGQANAVVKSFMAHHQGMTLLSLTYLLLNRPMQRRFESIPMFQATVLLLQERLPKATAIYSPTDELSETNKVMQPLEEKPIRVYTTPDTQLPEVQLLSNGRYHVMITNAGGGYSRWKDMAVTRWREDSTRDNWGSFVYIRDISNGIFWSTSYQPTLKTAKSYEAIFSEGRAEFRLRDEGFYTHTEIAVSPEDDIELRRITITNRSKILRTIDITSYSEVVIASPASDELHPVFSNLFVQTEIIKSQRAILATRRPRSGEEKSPWMFHTMSVHDAKMGEISYETDRAQFVGRGKTLAAPKAMITLAPLSGTQGAVLDPIAAIRCQISLEPGASASINFITGCCESRDVSIALVRKYQDRYLADRVFELAWTHSHVLLRQLNATEADAQLYSRLAAPIIYANSALRANASLIMKNLLGQSGLWRYSISGDLPIVLLRIEDQANIVLWRQLIQAHSYWRLKGLAVDLVICNEDRAGYRQVLLDQVMGLIAAGSDDVNMPDIPGGIFVRNADQISEEDSQIFHAMARVIISDSRGTLAEQMPRRVPMEIAIPPITKTRTNRPLQPDVAAMPREDLIFFNGTGGFTPDGREYVISTSSSQVTPAPWVNVIANPHFGTVVSESGSAYTWSENAHEFRLTPWHNDPVSDSCGEAFYLRDEERGHFWSPMPHPAKGTTPYVTRHGFGYTVFEHTERGISSEVWVYVAVDAPVKFIVIKVHNRSGRSRRLSVSGFMEWVLGDLRHKTVMHVISEVEPRSGAILAHNHYNAEFGNRVAFFNVDHSTRTLTADRTEFLGRNGTLSNPAAMHRLRLSGRTGAALDPCAAMQVPFELYDEEEREIVFTLGAGHNDDDATALANRFRYSGAARKALEAVWQYWGHTLGAVQVQTPDPSVNVIANGWLMYQTIACRLWARSGYYQSGGAFGFRDQLQDTMSLIYSEPGLVREHLLLCASHQFLEGDVQHWWHPPTGRGVRTHCSDDFLWLPLAACRYVETTGDTGVLDESICFINGRQVKPEEDSYYDLPLKSEARATLYEHCVRSISRSLRFGEHNLPLIGSGDWNDGMNMVGHEGKGESVWLAFFMCDVLTRFSAIARLRGEFDFSKQCGDEVERLRHNIAQHGWDGEWYIRAFFDDGTPIGSAKSQECKIDSIAQSWSVLSGMNSNLSYEHSITAMDSLDKYLVRRDDSLIQLLNPPFDKSALNPGYIKGYVPGVRENGGQYTHAAIWAAMAFAQLKDSSRAWEILSMINPVNHGNSADGIERYKVEPYVMAADVYAVLPHTGRGGWTWYTGSASWMYRLIMESLLGLRLEANRLSFEPCIPADWDGFTLHYRFRETIYHIKVIQKQTSKQKLDKQQAAQNNIGVREVDKKVFTTIRVNGILQQEKSITLVDDRKEHTVEVYLA